MKKPVPPKPWKPGQSGNPKGRPPGVGQAAKLRAAIEKDIPEIIKTLVGRAKEGDVGAARILIERVLPPLKASEERAPLNLPEGSLTEQGRAVLAAVAAGELSPGQGAALLASLGTLARVVEIDELADRVAALEGNHGSTGTTRTSA